MSKRHTKINLAEAERRVFGDGNAFKATIAAIGAQLGVEQFGCTLVELEPGKRAWPYHLHYAQEEMFVVLEGTGTLRYDDDTYSIRGGDVIFTPTGPGTAHQIVNTSAEQLRYLALGSKSDTELAEYPDSGKVGVGGPNFEPRYFFRAADAVDYFDGEDGES